MPLRSLIILFVAERCDSFGFCINLLTMLTLYVRSGLVWQIYLNDPISLLYCVGSTSFSFESFVNYSFGSAGVEARLHSSISNLLSISLAYFFCVSSTLYQTYKTKLQGCMRCCQEDTSQDPCSSQLWNLQSLSCRYMWLTNQHRDKALATNICSLWHINHAQLYILQVPFLLEIYKSSYFKLLALI